MLKAGGKLRLRLTTVVSWSMASLELAHVKEGQTLQVHRIEVPRIDGKNRVVELQGFADAALLMQGGRLLQHLPVG